MYAKDHVQANIIYILRSLKLDIGGIMDLLALYLPPYGGTFFNIHIIEDSFADVN